MSQVNSPGRTTITCPHFNAIAGTKRCEDYITNGSCRRPDQFMCVEWLKVNSAPAPVERDLFGATVARPAPKPRPVPTVTATPKPNLPMASSEPVASISRTVNEADVASFKAMGLEVCLESETLGQVWIVPEYTKAVRTELKVEHALLLATVGSVFPDARVTALRRPPEQGAEKSSDR